MKGNKNIEEIFKATFENFEESVDANVWGSIQSSIGQGAVATGSGSGLLGSLSAKITAAIIGAAAVIGSVYLIVQKNTSEKQELVQVEAEQEVEIPSESIPNPLVVPQEENISENQTEFVIKKVLETGGEMPNNTTSENNMLEEDGVTSIEHSEISSSIETNSNPNNETVVSNTVVPEKIAVEQIETVALQSEWTFSQEEDSEELIVEFAIPLNDQLEYLWDFGDGELSNEQNPTHYYNEEGLYNVVLTVSDEKGNFSESGSEIEIFLSHIIDIQDIFTPNDDLYNQYFDISASCKNVSINQVTIFNKNNQTVYEFSPEKSKWDGYDQLGNQCEQGYYFYTAQFLNRSGELIPVSGKVYLIR